MPHADDTAPPRHALITGANTGIGLTAAIALAQRGAQLTLACRDADRASAARETIRDAVGSDCPRVELLSLDLSSLAKVRDAAATFLDRGEPIDVLINNAGLAGRRGATRDGFELAFGVNHLGHFLWTLLLLPALDNADDARIVTVASRAHTRAPGIDFEAVTRPTSTRTGFPEYQVSKLANVLFSAELARRLDARGTGRPRLCTYSLHPGVVATDVWREVPAVLRGVMKWFMISSEDGAATTVHCATDPSCAGQSGLYYDECRVKAASDIGRDESLARALWERSAAWTNMDLPSSR